MLKGNSPSRKQVPNMKQVANDLEVKGKEVTSTKSRTGDRKPVSGTLRRRSRPPSVVQRRSAECFVQVLPASRRSKGDPCARFGRVIRKVI
jgi:hypothetical protein